MTNIKDIIYRRMVRELTNPEDTQAQPGDGMHHGQIDKIVVITYKL